MHSLRKVSPNATDGVAWSVSLCRFVGHVREPFKNGRTDRGAMWGDDSGGPKEPYIGWSSDLQGKEQCLGFSSQFKNIRSLAVVCPKMAEPIEVLFGG